MYISWVNGNVWFLVLIYIWFFFFGFGCWFGLVFCIFWVLLPIIDLAGTAFHSSQNVIKDDVTNIMPGIKTVVK